MTVQEDGSVLYAVYGTLRQNCGNHRRLQEAEYLGTIQTEPKYTMYTLGGFPGVAENGKDRITIEIYRATTPEQIRSVNGLEGYSGVRNSSDNWYDTCDVPTEWGIANMFTMNSLRANPRLEGNIISTGDWKNR